MKHYIFQKNVILDKRGSIFLLGLCVLTGTALEARRTNTAFTPAMTEAAPSGELSSPLVGDPVPQLGSGQAGMTSSSVGMTEAIPEPMMADPLALSLPVTSAPELPGLPEEEVFPPEEMAPEEDRAPSMEEEFPPPREEDPFAGLGLSFDAAPAIAPIPLFEQPTEKMEPFFPVGSPTSGDDGPTKDDGPPEAEPTLHVALQEDDVVALEELPPAEEKNHISELNDPDLFATPGEPKDVTLNFEGAELKSFIDYIADVRGMNIIPDKSVAGHKISLNFRNPVSKSGAWNAFTTILDLAGFSVVRVGLVHKVMPKDKKLRHPLPTFIGVASHELPDTDMTIRYLAFLNNIATQDVQPLLTSMLSNPSSIIPQPNVNGFIITDKAYNIKSAMKIIQELDQTGLNESVTVMRLKRANATDVKQFFDSLIKKPDNNNSLARLLGKQAEDSHSYFDSSTKIIAEERTNSLVLMGTKKSIEKIQKIITEHVDTELREAETPLHIYELQNTNAEEIVEILREVTSSQSIQSAAGQQAAKHGAVRGGVKYFKGMTFQADKEGNRLIVSCTDAQDWELLRETIRDLDKAQPQVAINMMVVSISAEKVRELGGQLRSKTHNMLGKNVDFQTHPIGTNSFQDEGGVKSLLGNLLSGITLAQGATLFSIGKVIGSAGGTGENGLWSVFKVLKKETDATLLSQPFLLTTNRTKGNIKFGESTWINTQSAVSTSGSVGSASGRTQVNAMTDITVLPQINMDGIMRLDVDIKINEFVPDSGGTKTQEKNLKTNVTVANGQVIALGGFVKTKISESGGQVPLLGSIPILGWLAKNRSRSTTKEYLFIFLSPTIVKPRSSPGVELYTKMKLHDATSQVEKAIQTEKTNDPVYNWFFNPDGENYSHKITDYANARYQPNTVDIKNDPLYRSKMAQNNFKTMHIADEKASPQEYIKRHKEAQKKAAEPATLSLPGAKIRAPEPTPVPRRNLPFKPAPPIIKPKPVVPAAQHTEMEESMLFGAQPFTPVFSEMSTGSEFPGPTQEAYQEQPVEFLPPTGPAMAPLPSSALEPPIETTLTIENAHPPSDIDDAIAQRRAQLKQLLSGGSLGQALLSPPTEVAPVEERPAEILLPAEEEAVTRPALPLLSRRSGLKNLLRTPGRSE